MADLTVFPIPQIPNGYNKLGKKLMIHDLTEPEATSTKLINFENILSTSVNYSELVNLITNNLLIEGGFYLLTDFQTVYDQMDFDAGGSLKPTLLTKTGATEQIWVLALAPNQIASQAYSATYPNDKIQYDWTYNTTLVNGSPAKGRISERIDENNNRTDYDHREIKFIRYDDGAGNFTVIKDNGNASGEFLTFVQNFTGGTVKDNWLGDFYSVGAFIGQEYANNVFSGGVVIANTSSALFNNNTFSGEVNSNTFGEVSNNNFSGYVNSNNFSGSVNSNNFSGNVYINTFSGNFYTNNFSGEVNNNTFSGEVSNNTFSGDVYNNTFSGEVNSNTFSDNVANNTFSGSEVYSNTFSGNVYSNTFSGNVYSNTFSGNVYNNTFSGNVYNNTFSSGEVYNNNTFSGEISNNTFSNNVTNNTFSGNININTFSGEVNNNTFSSIVYNNTFGYVSNNIFSGEVYNNIFSGNVFNNTFSGNVNNNTFSGDVYNNTFGYVSNNIFSGEVYNNTFSGNVSNNTFTYTGNLQYVMIADDLQSKTIDDTTYPFLFNTDYKKEILKGSNLSNYIRYFDGTSDVNTLIP